MNTWIIVGIIVVIVIICIISFININKIKKNGIETEAVISRINITTTQTIHDEDGTTDIDTTETYFVKFKTQNGEEIETRLPNPKMGLREGDVIKIKYLPEKPNKVIRIKE